MAVLVLLVLISGFVGGSDAAWCVCRGEAGTSALQKTLDYACGAGADCGPILQNGACYNPNTVLAHCSYAANSFFQRKGQAAGTCDFSGTAAITNTDPSNPGCVYPSTTSAAGTGTTTPGSTTTPGFTSSNNGGLGPSGNGSISNDVSVAGHVLTPGTATLALAVILPGLALFGA